MEDIDPIQELHEVRRKIVAKAGGTPAGLMKYLRALEKEASRKPIKPSVRKSVKRSKAVAQ